METTTFGQGTGGSHLKMHIDLYQTLPHPYTAAEMTDSLRVAHCSDIHLDGDHYHHDRYVEASDYYKDMFDRVLDTMQEHDPDLVLLAGDLFDSNQATKETIEWSMERIAAQPCPVAMIPGNHDCLIEGGIYQRHDFKTIPNLTFLTAEEGETLWIEELGVAVWGKGMVDHSPNFAPLGGRPNRPEECEYYIGMGHGIHVPHGEPSHRSSPIHMGEIEDSPFDYLALGHHHAAMKLVTNDSTAAYCGSPTDTVGGAATYAMIEIEKGNGTKLEVLAIPGTETK